MTMDAFELLKADHKKVAELFDRLEAASGKAKLAVFKQIKSELDLHAHIEEAIFYPAIEKPEETHDLTLEAYEEHKVIKSLLAELAAARSANDEWQAKAKVLRENVEHHVDEEEKELFDKADDVLSEEEVEALGNRMEAEKARKQGKPVPKKAAAKPKAKESKVGLLSRVAEFIGLGKKSEKKPAATKKPVAKKPTKKAAPKKGSKKASKSPSKTASQRASSSTAAKRTPSPAKNRKSGKASKKR